MAYGPQELLAELSKVFRGVDLILHAGDINSAFVLDELETIAPVLAARGNSDLALVEKRVKNEHVLEIEGFSLWLCHVFPYPDLDHYLDAVRSRFEEPGEDFNRMLDEAMVKKSWVPDIIVFGHTHRVLKHQHDRALLINPGSPVYPYHRDEPGTVAILSLAPGSARAEIIQL